MLSRSGVASVEATSFVHPKWVPQMADHKEVIGGIAREGGVAYPVLVPNLRGFENAVGAGADSVAVIAIPSETFSQKNLKMSVEENKLSAAALVREAVARGVPCRAYISCALGCPFEGLFDGRLKAIAEIATALVDAGCYEIALSDTIGAGTAGDMDALLREVVPNVDAKHLAVHCHDTYGQALSNILNALEHGVTVVDSSVAGLGGCPFAGPGAAGNVATEDVVYMLHGLGVSTGVDFDAVVDAGQYVVGELGRPNASRASVAYRSRGRK